MNNHQSSVSPEEIKKWIESIAYQLDSPGTAVLQEQTSILRDWNKEPYKSDFKFCLVSPVEYSAVISNLGLSILYNELNDNGKDPSTTGVLCERAYFPEKKLVTRLEKKGYPLFSKESFTPLCNFDSIAFSSYYALQFFNIPRMLEMSNIPVWSKDRDGKNAPIIGFGGIAAYNPEPVSDFIDWFFMGEGEHNLHKVTMIMKECRTEEGIDKDKLLWRLAKETDFIYVPSFYEVHYFPGRYGVKERKSLNEVAKPIIKRSLCNIYTTPPLTRTFVPVCDSADMSISSVEISRGKCAADTKIFTQDNGVISVKPLSEVKKKDNVSALSSVTQSFLGVKDTVSYPSSTEMLKITTKKGREIIASKDHPFLIENKWSPLVTAKVGQLIAEVSRIPINVLDNPDFSEEELFVIGLMTAGGKLIRNNHLFYRFESPKKELVSLLTRALDILNISYAWTVSSFPNYIYAVEIDLEENSGNNNLVSYRLFYKWNLINADKKHIWPSFVYSLSLYQRAVLLGAFATYSLDVLANENTVLITFRIDSKEQAQIFQDMLWSFGAHPAIHEETTYSHKYWEITLDSWQDINAASFVLLKIHYREDVTHILSLIPNDSDSPDVFPHNVWEEILKIKDSLGYSWKGFNEYYATGKGEDAPISSSDRYIPIKAALQAINYAPWHKYFVNNQELQRAISEDIYWDEIASIEKLDYPVDAADITTEHPYHTYVANGFYVHNCSASCSFCEGSARTMPLRERPLNVALKAFDDIRKETGCFDTTPYGFNLSDHSNIRTILRYLAKNQDVKIQMSSQRIDMFTEDFATLAYATGNRSVTLAIEGGSQRMRNAVNKNLSTQQILEAFEIAMKIGFTKVKIYMISNLPFETSQDIDGTPSQLTTEHKEGDTTYENKDAIQIEFEDGTSMTVSKDYVFAKDIIGTTTADALKPGDIVQV